MNQTANSEAYLEPSQSRLGPPTDFENELGDAIESAYAAGIYDLDGVVARLNDSGPKPPDGGTWNADRFTELMKDVGR